MQKSIKKYFHVSQFFDLCNARIIEIINSDGSNPIGSICQKELKMYYYTLEYIQGHFNFRATILLKLDPSSFVWRQIQLNSHHDFSSSVLFDNDHDIDQNWGAAFMENEKYFGKNVGEEIFHFLKANVWLFMTSGEYRSVLICVAWHDLL